MTRQVLRVAELRQILAALDHDAIVVLDLGDDEGWQLPTQVTAQQHTDDQGDTWAVLDLGDLT